MEAKLESKVRKIRETLGSHLQYMNSLVDPIYDRKTWTDRMAMDALDAANVAHTSSSQMLTEIEHLKSEDGIKKDPALREKVKWMLSFVGEAFMSSGRLIEIARQEPQNEHEAGQGIGWAIIDSRIGIAIFRHYFGEGKSGAWSLLRTVWSLLFFLPADLEVISYKLGAFETKGFYEDEVTRGEIYDKVHAIVENENAVVELYDVNENLIDAWGPSEVRVARSHAAKDWARDYQLPGTVTKLTRPLTKTEQERAYGIYLSSPDRYANVIDAIKALRIPGLVIEGVGAKSMPLKHTLETYITKDKYFVSKGKRISRPLGRDEIRFVKDVMRNKPDADIEFIAQGLGLDVVKLPEEYEVKDILHSFQAQSLEARRAVPNISSEDKKVYNMLLKWRRRG